MYFFGDPYDLAARPLARPKQFGAESWRVRVEPPKRSHLFPFFPTI
jgi:hypothetical protein